MKKLFSATTELIARLLKLVPVGVQNSTDTELDGLIAAFRKIKLKLKYIDDEKKKPAAELLNSLKQVMS